MAYSPHDSNPIEVVLKNLGTLLPVAVVFLGWLAATWKKLAKQSAPPRAPVRPAGDEEERTRRIKEEVRRKIVERRGAPAPTSAPAPLPAPAGDYLAEQARQERLAKEMAAIEAGLPPPIAAHQPYAPSSSSPAPALGWLEALRDPLNVRRAIVLREVLGPPMGLR